MSSTSIFYPVRAASPLAGAGWQVKVRDYTLGSITDGLGTRPYWGPVVAVLSEFTSLSVGRELNGSGAGSVTIKLDSPLWTRLLTNGQSPATLKNADYLFEAYEDGVLRGQWLCNSVVDTIVGDDETPAVSISGPGPADALKWAKVFPPNFPAPPPPTGLVWPWATDLATPAMKIWLWLLNAAKARGTVPFIAPTFSDWADSGGVAWDDVTHPYTRLTPFAPDLGSDLLTQLNTLTGQDLTAPAGMRAEWTMWPGLKLDVRPTIGVHREHEVVFFEGGHVLTNERASDRTGMANVVVVRDANGAMSVATDAASIGLFHRREELVDEANLTDAPRRDAAAAVVLAQRSPEPASWTIAVDYDVAGRRVFKDFDIGDWIGVQRMDPDGSVVREAYRVVAITVAIDEDGVATAELTLQTLLDSVERQLQIQLTTIKNTIVNGGVTLPTPSPPASVPLVFDPVTGTWGPGSWPALGGGTSLTPTLLGSNPGYSDGYDVGYSVSHGWYAIPWGAAGGAGVHVWIQNADPGGSAAVGDLWVQTP